MQIQNNPLTLFDFIGNRERANEVLDGLAKGSGKDVSAGIKAFDAGLNQNEFEDTLKRIEGGELDVDLPTIENYFEFNQNRLASAVETLQRSFELDPAAEVVIKDGELVVSEHPDKDRIENYLQQDRSLNTLITQTSKLSQFVEWAQAKGQAAIFKDQGMPEAELVEFLKDARTVVTDSNRIILTDQSASFLSQGRTSSVIDKYTAKPDTN